MTWANDSQGEIDKGSLLFKLPMVLLALGAASLIYWWILAGEDRGRAMYGYLFSYVTVLSLLLGCLAFVLIQHVTRAGWSVVVRRIPEAAIYLLPLFIVFFIPIALFMGDIFVWTHADHLDEILLKKTGYLNQTFFLLRSFAYLAIWAVMGVWFYRVSVSQDIGGRFERTRILQAISAPGIIIYGLTLTFASFDWIMSLQPHWYSTIFGVYYFSGALLFGLAFITLMAMLLQKVGGLSGAITSEHYHDLGKLLFGFTVFWAYIAFSQFMLYWYAAIPEEVEFYAHRLDHGWEQITWGMPIFHFFIPFFALMSRALKRVKLMLAINCCFIIVVHFIDVYWLVLPAYQDPHVLNGPAHFNVNLYDLLPLFGMLSIFFGCWLLVMSRNKLMPVGDPRFSESLAFENF